MSRNPPQGYFNERPKPPLDYSPALNEDGTEFDIVKAAEIAKGYPDAGLRAAAQRVVASAEPDDNFDGEYIEYLIPADVLDALRAALASFPAPAGLDVLEDVAHAIALESIPRGMTAQGYRKGVLRRMYDALDAAARPAEDAGA